MLELAGVMTGSASAPAARSVLPVDSRPPAPDLPTCSMLLSSFFDSACVRGERWATVRDGIECPVLTISVTR
jgi:hypothetical protein